MDTVQRTQERPGTITLVVVLAWIAGILNIAAGIFVIIDRHNGRIRVDAGSTPNELLAWGIAAIVVGAFFCVLASFLSRGSRTARLIFGILAILNLASGLYYAIAYSGEQRSSGVVSFIFSLVVLWLLYGTEKDREYFGA